MKHGKKYVEAAKVYDKQTQYDRDEAVAIVKKLATAKFDRRYDRRNGRSGRADGGGSSKRREQRHYCEH